MKDKYRGTQFSVLVQPKRDECFTDKQWSDLWMNSNESTKINYLMDTGFPLHTQLVYALTQLRLPSLSEKTNTKVKRFAFGTETSVETKIPHFQIFVEFPVAVRSNKIYEELDKLLHNKVHIVTEKVYTEGYLDYCVKTYSNYEFTSEYYWNIKYVSEDYLNEKQKTLVSMRPKLKNIKDNYFTGQKLLHSIATGEPDDRTGVWLADVIGGTGKTGFFQTVVDDVKVNGCYLRVSEGVERLSAKLRKKITTRLNQGRGYPKFVWINFGRTVEEGALKAFSDFAEQILDGMLDDNFGNTAGTDFVPLPYVNLIVTANTPPNLKQLTSDRLKLLTLFPIYEDTKTLVVKDSLLIPIYVEIKVRILKRFPHNLDYKFKIKLQDMDYITQNFSQFSWFDELLENVNQFMEFQLTDEYRDDYYASRLESDWFSTVPSRVQSDIFQVYQKALFHSATITGPGTGAKFVEASSFNKVKPKSYWYTDANWDNPGGLPDFSNIYSKIPE